MEIKRLCPRSTSPVAVATRCSARRITCPGSTARHDRVVWAYAQGAMQRGVHVLQGTQVTGLLRDGERVVGVKTSRGDIAAGMVMSAVGGDVSTIAAHAGLRLPVRTHPLQAFVTNGYTQGLGPIVSSTDLLCYVSQTARGQMLIGHEFERESSYSRQSSFQFLQSCSLKMAFLLPVRPQPQDPAAVDGAMRHLRRLLPDHGLHGRRRIRHHHRLGNVGIQRHPCRRRADGRTDRDWPHARSHRPVRAVRDLPPITRWPTRARRDRADVDDRLPQLRSAAGRGVPLRRRTARAARRPHRANSTATSIGCGCSPTPTASRPSAGSTRQDATAGTPHAAIPPSTASSTESASECYLSGSQHSGGSELVRRFGLHRQPRSSSIGM